MLVSVWDQLYLTFSFAVRLLTVDWRLRIAIDLFGSRGASSLPAVDSLKNEMEKHTQPRQRVIPPPCGDRRSLSESYT